MATYEVTVTIAATNRDDALAIRDELAARAADMVESGEMPDGADLNVGDLR